MPVARRGVQVPKAVAFATKARAAKAHYQSQKAQLQY